MVEEFQHVVVVSDLLVTGGVFLVWLSAGNFVKHGHEVHVGSTVAFDKVFELLQDGDQWFLVLVRLLDLLAQPSMMDSVVSWQPRTCSAIMVSSASVQI